MEELVSIGGLVDQSSVSLCLYGEDLDPNEVSSVLGVPGDRMHRRGDKRREGTSPFQKGAWAILEEGSAPLGPEELLERIAERVPTDPAIWAGLGRRFDLQVRFGIHQSEWNRGFDLSQKSVRFLERIGASLVFDIYCDGDAA